MRLLQSACSLAFDDLPSESVRNRNLKQAPSRIVQLASFAEPDICIDAHACEFALGNKARLGNSPAPQDASRARCGVAGKGARYWAQTPPSCGQTPQARLGSELWPALTAPAQSPHHNDCLGQFSGPDEDEQQRVSCIELQNLQENQINLLEKLLLLCLPASCSVCFVLIRAALIVGSFFFRVENFLSGNVLSNSESSCVRCDATMIETYLDARGLRVGLGHFNHNAVLVRAYFTHGQVQHVPRESR